MSTTLSLTLTILALIIFFSAVVWRLTARSCPTCALLKDLLADEKVTNRALLGLPAPTVTTSESKPIQSSPPPETDPLDEFESLSPEIQQVLLREYAEHLSQYPKSMTAHPEVEQIVPGQIVSVSP